jgi:uncharacterized protein DUF1707
MLPEDPSEISRMRISDADRDRAASILNEAFADGRLTPQEHSDRLDAIFAAKTQADILPLFSDLPGAAVAFSGAPRSLSPRYAGGAVAQAGKPTRVVCVFSGITRKGAWRVPAELEAVTVFGGADLDLREAVLPAKQINIRAICVLGGMDIVVPPEMHVVDTGWALLGGREIPPDTEESADPDAPVLRVSGVTILGGISVRRKRRKGDKPRPELTR